MLDRLAFVSVPNCLNFCCRKMPVIVIGGKPTCWECVQTGHLSSSCLEKKAGEVPAAGDPNFPLANIDSSETPVMGLPRTFPPKPTLVANASKEKKEKEWRAIGSDREKNQTAGPHSPETLREKVTYSHISSTIFQEDAPASYATSAREIQKK